MTTEDNAIATIEDELMGAVSDATIVWTDGTGSVRRQVGDAASSEQLARDVDLSLLLLQAVGDRQSLAQAETLLVTYHDGMLALARIASGGNVGIRAARRTTGGMLMSYVHRLVAAAGNP